MVLKDSGYTTFIDNNNLKNLQHNNYNIQEVSSFNEFDDPELTPIQRFYDGASVLITGSTGFLGKILVEKLLRSCPTISTLYLVIRNKKGKNLEERVDEMFEDLIFDRLKRECPKYRHKVVGVGGDCSLPELGLSLQDRRLLTDEISVVFHVAATVRFDEKMRSAVAINIRSPQDLLRLAREMPKLKSFIHVSTAFGNCHHAVIEEKIYPPAVDGKKLLMIAENVPEDILDEITPKLLGVHPNTYAFTKQIAEDVVRQESENLPVGIVRPAIVISTYREPIRAWINNLYGPTGVSAGAGLGLLRILHCDPEVTANLVPVDMCVNSIIASAWQVGEKFQKALKDKKPFEVPVYNYETSNDQPISWGRFMHLTEKHGFAYPTEKAIWYYCFTLIRSYPIYLILTFLLHTIPAILTDIVLFCIGKPPRMLKAYKKIHKFSSVISYFSIRQWAWKSNNVRHLVEEMSERDQDIFFSDLKQLDWNEFFMDYIKGMRVYLLQDSFDTLAHAKTKWRRLYFAHQTVKLLGVLLLLQILYWLIKFSIRSLI